MRRLPPVFWLGLGLAAGMPTPARAQTVLRYGTREAAVVVTDILAGRAMYVQDGKTLAAPAGARWFLEPAQTYAAPTGEIAVSQEVKYLARPDPKDDEINIRVEITFQPDAPATGLYVCCAWQAEGRLVAIDVTEMMDCAPGTPGRRVCGLAFKAAARRGTLLAYVFQDGRSLSGVGRAHGALAPLRALLDRGRVAEAEAWLRAARPDRGLPQSMIEQIAQLGQASMLELALAGPNAKRATGAEGELLLLAAAKAGQEGTTGVLLRSGANPNADDKRGDTALYHAVKANAASVVKQLLEAGANPNRGSPKSQETPLSYALRYDHLEIARLLLEHGAKSPDKKQRESLLASAVNHREAALVEFLLAHGADANQVVDGSPALMAAATRGDSRTLGLLLGAGAKVDAKNPDGETPLMGAAFAGDEASVAVLRRSGASLTAADRNARTAAGFAIRGGHTELAVKLFEASPLSGQPASRLLHDAVVADAAAMIAALRARQIELDVTLSDIESALDRVVAGGDMALLQSALDHGFEVNRRIFADWTLGALALRYSQSEIFAELKRRAGDKLEVTSPLESNSPLRVYTRFAEMKPTAFGAESDRGSALVDIFVDAEGFVRAPVLLGASDAQFGRAMIRAVLCCRYLPADDNAKIWRRTTVEWTSEKKEPPLVVITEQPKRRDNWVRPLPWDQAGEFPQAALMRFTVSVTGEVMSPSVLASTRPELKAQAEELVKAWQFFPAKAGAQPVETIGVAVVLLPSGAMAGFNSLHLIPTPQTVGLGLPTLKSRNRFLWNPFAFPADTPSGLVVVRFVINGLGFTSQIKVLGSTNPELAKRAHKLCDAFEFEPVEVGGRPVERPMLWVVALGRWDDAAVPVH